MAAFSPVAGKLSDVIEPRIIASIGMGINAIGLALISFFTDGTEVWMMVAVLAFLGFGFALFSSPNTNAIMSSVEKRNYGIASASVGTMRLVGQALSLGIATMLIAVYVGSTEMSSELAPEFMDAFQPGFIIFSILCFVGIFASLARGRLRPGSS
jgi:MFS family permease